MKECTAASVTQSHRLHNHQSWGGLLALIVCILVVGAFPNRTIITNKIRLLLYIIPFPFLSCSASLTCLYCIRGPMQSCPAATYQLQTRTQPILRDPARSMITNGVVNNTKYRKKVTDVNEWDLLIQKMFSHTHNAASSVVAYGGTRTDRRVL